MYILFDIIWYPFWSLLFSRVEDKRRVGAIQADSFQKEQGRLPLLTINESGVGLIQVWSRPRGSSLDKSEIPFIYLQRYWKKRIFPHATHRPHSLARLFHQHVFISLDPWNCGYEQYVHLGTGDMGKHVHLSRHNSEKFLRGLQTMSLTSIGRYNYVSDFFYSLLSLTFDIENN